MATTAAVSAWRCGLRVHQPCLQRMLSTQSKLLDSGPRVEFAPTNAELSDGPLLLKDAVTLMSAFSRWNETTDAYFKTDTHDKNKKKGRPRDPFRGLAVLPHAFKPAKSIVVFARGANAAAAKAAGAQHVGDRELLEEVLDDKIAFDVALATPDMLKDLKPAARILRASMPSVKRGTVREDIDVAVKEFLNGIQYRSNEQGYVIAPFGKINFTQEELELNLKHLLLAVDSHRLTSKGKFVEQLSIGSTQGGFHIIDQSEVERLLRQNE